ncbi:phosphatase PAP2 family protein [Nocardioides sp. CN2-186]|uniref:phosphatase PAP2 family protein n=1 Tax=Nocardioides tweenelious TaxID=3156607 RepID=UPI0032B3C883
MRLSVPYIAGPPVGDDGSADVEPDHRWLLRTWLVVVVFAAITLWRSHEVGIPLRDPHGEILRSRVAITVGVFAALAVLDAVRRTPRGSRRPRVVGAMLRRRWPLRRLGLAASGLLAYHLVYFCYHNLKSWDVLNAPQDDALTRLDRALFLGHSPAVLLHSALGVHWAAYALVLVYESFPTLVTIAFVAAVVFADRLRDGMVFLASAIWVWILGVGCYYLVPSLGPFDNAPQDFAGLPHTIVTRTQALYLGQRADLLADPAAHDSFAQISAFASLHVGVTTVIVLMLAYYRFRRATLVMSVYLALTIVATIYLGWHFFVDDVAGLVIAAAAVGLGHLTIYPAGRPPLGSAGSESREVVRSRRLRA